MNAARTRRLAAAALAAYLALLVVAVLSPVSDRPATLVTDLTMGLLGLGASPELVTFNRVEVVMNAVIVVPPVFLGSLVWPRLRWQEWVTYGFLTAIAVELIQGLLLSQRQASFSDIVANTAGALVGALVGEAFRRQRR